MPIIVACPKCGTSLPVPEVAAGKKTRCTKYGFAAIVDVPPLVVAEPVTVVDAIVIPPSSPPSTHAEPARRGFGQPVDVDDASRPGEPPSSEQPRRDDDEGEEKPRKNWWDDDSDGPPRKTRRWEDEDDERSRRGRRREDDDDEPSRKRRQNDAGTARKPRRGRKNKGPNKTVVIVVASVVGGILLLGVLTVVIVSFIGRKADPPVGWREHTFADLGFKAYFPKPPTVQRRVRTIPGLGRGTNLAPLETPLANLVEDGASYVSGNESVQISLWVIRYKPTEDLRLRIETKIRELAQGNVSIRSVRWLGVARTNTPTAGVSLASPSSTVPFTSPSFTARAAVPRGRKNTGSSITSNC